MMGEREKLLLAADVFMSCPVCGEEDAIWLECESDSDDYRTWVYGIVMHVDCGCDLTPEQQDTIQNDCAETCSEPWEP